MIPQIKFEPLLIKENDEITLHFPCGGIPTGAKISVLVDGNVIAEGIRGPEYNGIIEAHIKIQPNVAPGSHLTTVVTNYTQLSEKEIIIQIPKLPWNKKAVSYKTKVQSPDVFDIIIASGILRILYKTPQPPPSQVDCFVLTPSEFSNILAKTTGIKPGTPAFSGFDYYFAPPIEVMVSLNQWLNNVIPAGFAAVPLGGQFGKLIYGNADCDDFSGFTFAVARFLMPGVSICEVIGTPYWVDGTHAFNLFIAKDKSVWVIDNTARLFFKVEKDMYLGIMSLRF